MPRLPVNLFCDSLIRRRDAIEQRAELSETERADHLAVLSFVVGAEGLPAQMVKSWISEGRLMESEWYRSVVARGEAKQAAETIIRILMRRMKTLDPAIRDKIRTLSDTDTLNFWYEEALGVVDAEGASRLAETIQNTPVAQITT